MPTIGILMTRRKVRPPEHPQDQDLPEEDPMAPLPETRYEYRVKFAQNMNSIREKPDYPHPSQARVNRQRVLQIFGEARVFYELKEAHEAAKELRNRIVWTRKRIQLLDFRNMFFPAPQRKFRKQLVRPAPHNIRRAPSLSQRAPWAR